MSNVTVDGTPGEPGAAGAAGGIGGAAPATNTGTDTSNSATAVGGAGGKGGGGPTAGAGGAGGAATATATTPASVTGGINATATATGGGGGDAGTPSGGGTGAVGGGGGTAASTATLTTITTGIGTTVATSTGGAGGSPSGGGPGTAGGAGGSANAAATTTANGGTADATALATGGGSAASIGANGIDGAGAMATAAGTGIAATIIATAVGGEGGGATGAGNTAGKGASLNGLAVISDAAVATATASSGTGSAEASATGGAGGAGSAGAAGGAGGDATLTNAVTGSSSGTVSLTQNASGGAGGGSTTGAGAGGSATSTVTTTPTANPLEAVVTATGGVGGAGGTGKAGGAATATLDSSTAGTITTTNGIVVQQTAIATGGDGGASTTAVGGAAGNASASDIATTSGGIGGVSVQAQAAAGAGGTGTSTGAKGTATAIASANTKASEVSATAPGTASADAIANAQKGGSPTTLGSGTATATTETANGLLAKSLAEATGGAGTVNSSAITSGGLLLKLTALAGAPTDGETFAGATAENGTPTSGAFDTSDNSYAAAGGLAKFATLGPDVGAAFNKSGAVIFGTGSLGAVYSPDSTGAQIYTSSISFDVNTASLPAGGALDLGLVTPEDGGHALTSMTFELTEDGNIVVPAATLNTAGAANTYFTDDLMNLGAPEAGVAGDLNVTVTVSETLGASGAAHGVDFMVGVVPCFAAGTLILTTRGEVRVEDLRVGDCAVSGFGGCSEIIWTGHREVDCTRHPVPSDVWPVRICAGAFGEGMPVRFLRLSPDHALFVEGNLIPAKYLVNGTTVVREAAAWITYWHVECARHEVLLAEGLPAESYLDTGNRDGFADAAVVSLFPDFGIGAREVWEQSGCRPLVEAGPALDAARSLLAERAVALGFAPVAFQRVELDRVGSVQVVLPAGVERVHLVSACRVPEGERRRLGAAIGAIALDGVSLWDAGTDSGFYPAEQSAGGMYRWTDGEGVLRVEPADRPRALEVSVVMLVRAREADRRTG